MDLLAQDLGLPTRATFLDYEAITAPNFVGQNIGYLFNQPFGIVTIMFFVAGALLLLYLVWGGFEMMTSSGNPDAIASGKKRITNAIIGIFIVLIAFWIVQLIGLMFGITAITDTF